MKTKSISSIELIVLKVLCTITAFMIICKLLDIIDWSWIIVFSPLWIPIAIVVIITVFAIIGAILFFPNEIKKHRLL